MNRYKDYMDALTVSDTLHQRLTELEPPSKRRLAWKKYGAAAAALVLVAGVGAYGLSRGGWDAADTGWGWDLPAISIVDVGREEIGEPDIAPAGPNDPYAPADRTDGGYEVRDGDMAEYIALPYLNWADAAALPQTSMDYQLAAPGAIDRETTWDDVLVFMSGERAMADHLLWDGLGWSGTIWFLEDGTPQAAALYADENGLYLYLEVMKGGEVPSCEVLPEEYYETSQWQGVEITAVKNGGLAVIDGVRLDEKREVSLYTNGVGYKLTLYADDAARADELCARFVRYAVDGGFHLDLLSADGAVGDSGGPDYSVSAPDYEDGAAMTAPYDPSAPQTTPYDPSASN